MYKLYMGLLTRLLLEHGLLPMEEKAIRKGSRGCLNALVIEGAASQS